MMSAVAICLNIRKRPCSIEQTHVIESMLPTSPTAKCACHVHAINARSRECAEINSFRLARIDTHNGKNGKHNGKQPGWNGK